MSRAKKYATSPTFRVTSPQGEAKRRVIVVKHPEHGTYTAKGVKDNLQAVIAAARAWGLQWSKIARECEFTEGKDDAVDATG